MHWTLVENAPEIWLNCDKSGIDASGTNVFCYGLEEMRETSRKN